MKFSTKIEDIDFTIEIHKTPHFDAINKATFYSREDLDDLNNGEIEHYEMTVVSTKNDESLTHYFPGLLISTDENEIASELEEILDTEEIFEKILEVWDKAYDNSEGPAWKKN